MPKWSIGILSKLVVGQKHPEESTFSHVTPTVENPELIQLYFLNQTIEKVF